MTAAAATELATTRKYAKYVELSTTHHFNCSSSLYKSLGPIGFKTTNFLKEIGRCLTLAMNNPMETAYLFHAASGCSIAEL